MFSLSGSQRVYSFFPSSLSPFSLFLTLYSVIPYFHPLVATYWHRNMVSICLAGSGKPGDDLCTLSRSSQFVLFVNCPPGMRIAGCRKAGAYLITDLVIGWNIY